MENLADEFKSLPEAAKLFPKLVFREWLKMRRQGADQFFPSWRHTDNKRAKVYALDLGARLKAGFN